MQFAATLGWWFAEDVSVPGQFERRIPSAAKAATDSNLRRG